MIDDLRHCRLGAFQIIEPDEAIVWFCILIVWGGIFGLI